MEAGKRITALEAKELYIDSKSGRLGLGPVYDAIREKSKNDTRLAWKERLSPNAIDQLRSDGYTVKDETIVSSGRGEIVNILIYWF